MCDMEQALLHKRSPSIGNREKSRSCRKGAGKNKYKNPVISIKTSTWIYKMLPCSTLKHNWTYLWSVRCLILSRRKKAKCKTLKESDRYISRWFWLHKRIQTFENYVRQLLLMCRARCTMLIGLCVRSLGETNAVPNQVTLKGRKAERSVGWCSGNNMKNIENVPQPLQRQQTQTNVQDK